MLYNKSQSSSCPRQFSTLILESLYSRKVFLDSALQMRMVDENKLYELNFELVLDNSSTSSLFPADWPIQQVWQTYPVQSAWKSDMSWISIDLYLRNVDLEERNRLLSHACVRILQYKCYSLSTVCLSNADLSRDACCALQTRLPQKLQRRSSQINIRSGQRIESCFIDQ